MYFDKVPAVFGYINAVNEAITDYRDVSADLFISLDLSDPERLGDAKPYFDNADITINIDHHIVILILRILIVFFLIQVQHVKLYTSFLMMHLLIRRLPKLYIRESCMTQEYFNTVVPGNVQWR